MDKMQLDRLVRWKIAKAKNIRRQNNKGGNGKARGTLNQASEIPGQEVKVRHWVRVCHGQSVVGRASGQCCLSQNMVFVHICFFELNFSINSLV